MLKVDADEGGVGGDDAADALSPDSSHFARFATML
jgi:hypothetical protein